MVGGLTAVWLTALVDAWVAEVYVTTFSHSDGPLEVALARGDGQAYAALAADPTLARPSVIQGGPDEAAYRAQRPLLPYLAWALAGGRRRFVNPALVAWYVLGSALMVGAAAALLDRARRRPEPALLLLGVPSSLAAFQWFGPEPLALGLALAGLLARRRPGAAGAWTAGGLFLLATLARETMVVVPLALAAAGRARGRRGAAALAPYLLAPAGYLAWSAVVRARVGAWPWAGGACRAGFPGTGLLRAMDSWPARPVGNALVLASLVAVAALCVVRRPTHDLTWVVVAFVAVGALMGTCVWLRWEDFSRPLLPVYGFGLLALADRPGRADTVQPLRSRAREERTWPRYDT